MTPWVSRLLFANVAIFLAAGAFPALPGALALVPVLVPVRPWTPVTYMFVHAGLWHIVFNMMGLYFFGQRLEAHLGGPRFISLYLLSGLGGAALSILTPTAHIVGASGAVFGVFLGYARFWPRDRVMVWGIVPVEARVLVLLTAGYTIVAALGGLGRMGGGVAHFAHLGGYGAALLYLTWLEHRSPARQFQRRMDTALYGDRGTVRPPEPSWDAIRREGLHPLNLEELDRLAAKVEAEGTKSLTPDERAFLHRMSTR